MTERKWTLAEIEDAYHAGLPHGFEISVKLADLLRELEALPQELEVIEIYNNPLHAEIFRGGHTAALANLPPLIIAENERLKTEIAELKSKSPLQGPAPEFPSSLPRSPSPDHDEGFEAGAKWMFERMAGKK